MLLMFERVNRNVLSKCEEFSDNGKSNLFSHDISDKNGNGIGRETEFTFKFIFTCMKNSEKKKQPDDGKLNFVAVRKSKMYFVETSQTFVTFILVYCCRNFNSVLSTLFFQGKKSTKCWSRHWIQNIMIKFHWITHWSRYVIFRNSIRKWIEEKPRSVNVFRFQFFAFLRQFNFNLDLNIPKGVVKCVTERRFAWRSIHAISSTLSNKTARFIKFDLESKPRRICATGFIFSKP